MDIQEYTEKLKQLSEEAADKARERSILLSANELLANIKNRIQREGKDSSDQKMDGYSTKPLYAERDRFVKKSSFSAKGKVNKGDFKNGKKRKSMYFQHGYKEFREVQGRQTNVKDLTMSGDLMNSYVLGQEEGVVKLGFNSIEESKKRKGLEKQNGGKIVYATQKEMDNYKKNVIAQQKDLITKMFQ